MCIPVPPDISVLKANRECGDNEINIPGVLPVKPTDGIALSFHYVKNLLANRTTEKFRNFRKIPNFFRWVLFVK